MTRIDVGGELPKVSNATGPVRLGELRLYVCQNCGAVFARNFRDEWCRVCNVTMQVLVIRIPIANTWHLAPHEDEEEN